MNKSEQSRKECDKKLDSEQLKSIVFGNNGNVKGCEGKHDILMKSMEEKINDEQLKWSNNTGFAKFLNHCDIYGR